MTSRVIQGKDPDEASSQELDNQLPNSSGQMASHVAKDLGDGSPYAKTHKERMSEKTDGEGQV